MSFLKHTQADYNSFETYDFHSQYLTSATAVF